MTSELQAAAAALPETETLRDKMAMAALTGIIAGVGGKSVQDISECAYEFADAMMTVRQKGGTV